MVGKLISNLADTSQTHSKPMTESKTYVHSFTASHINCVGRPAVLYLAVESLFQSGVNNVYLSISYAEELEKTCKPRVTNLLTSLRQQYPERGLCIHEQPYPMTQFDHLHYLYDHYKGSPNDYVLFCDDDDLLLQIPVTTDKANVVQGFQYIPVSSRDVDATYKANRTELLGLEDSLKHECLQEVDFSGCMCRYHGLGDYFSKRSKSEAIGGSFGHITRFLSHLEDIDFMQYLDGVKGGVYRPSKPFVFHRMWSDESGTNTSDWRRVFCQ